MDNDSLQLLVGMIRQRLSCNYHEAIEKHVSDDGKKIFKNRYDATVDDFVKIVSKYYELGYRLLDNIVKDRKKEDISLFIAWTCGNLSKLVETGKVYKKEFSDMDIGKIGCLNAEETAQNEKHIMKIFDIIFKEFHFVNWNDPESNKNSILRYQGFRDIEFLPIFMPFMGPEEIVSGEFIIYMLSRGTIKLYKEKTECLNRTYFRSTKKNYKDPDVPTEVKQKINRYFYNQHSYKQQFKEYFDVDLNKYRNECLFPLFELYDHVYQYKEVIYTGQKKTRVLSKVTSVKLDDLTGDDLGEPTIADARLMVFRTILWQNISFEKRHKLFSYMLYFMKYRDEISKLATYICFSKHIDFNTRAEGGRQFLEGFKRYVAEKSKKNYCANEKNEEIDISLEDLCQEMLFALFLKEEQLPMYLLDRVYDDDLPDSYKNKAYTLTHLRTDIGVPIVKCKWNDFYRIAQGDLEILLDTQDKKELKKIWCIARNVFLYLSPDESRLHLLTSIEERKNQPKRIRVKDEIYRNYKGLLVLMMAIKIGKEIDILVSWYGGTKQVRKKTLYQALDNIRANYSKDLMKGIQWMQQFILYKYEGGGPEMMNIFKNLLYVVNKEYCRAMQCYHGDFIKTESDVFKIFVSLFEVYSKFSTYNWSVLSPRLCEKCTKCDWGALIMGMGCEKQYKA